MNFALTYDTKTDRDPINKVLIALDEAGVRRLSIASYTRKTSLSTIEFEYDIADENAVKNWMDGITAKINPDAYVRLYKIDIDSGEERVDLNPGLKEKVSNLTKAGVLKNQSLE
jgi:hypothetical protein